MLVNPISVVQPGPRKAFAFILATGFTGYAAAIGAQSMISDEVAPKTNSMHFSGPEFWSTVLLFLLHIVYRKKHILIEVGKLCSSVK